MLWRRLSASTCPVRRSRSSASLTIASSSYRRAEGLVHVPVLSRQRAAGAHHRFAVRREFVELEALPDEVHARTARFGVADRVQQGLGNGGGGSFVDPVLPVFGHRLDEQREARHQAAELDVVVHVAVHEAAEHFRGHPPQALQVVALDPVAHGLADALHGRQQGRVVLVLEPVFQGLFILAMQPACQVGEGFVEARFLHEFQFREFHVEQGREHRSLRDRVDAGPFPHAIDQWQQQQRQIRVPRFQPIEIGGQNDHGFDQRRTGRFLVPGVAVRHGLDQAPHFARDLPCAVHHERVEGPAEALQAFSRALEHHRPGVRVVGDGFDLRAHLVQFAVEILAHPADGRGRQAAWLNHACPPG